MSNSNKYVILMKEYTEGYYSFSPSNPYEVRDNPYNRNTSEQQYHSFERGFLDFLTDLRKGL